MDTPLDEGGWRDAWTAAGVLKDKQIEAIYSSPLRRARDTARIIADATGVCTVVDLPGLVNLNYGDWDALINAGGAGRLPAGVRGLPGLCPGCGNPLW